MVLVATSDFFPKLTALFQQEIKGGTGAVTVRTKSIPSAKVGKELRDQVVSAGPTAYLVRAYKNGNNSHKIKLSTAVTEAQHIAFKAQLAQILKAKMQHLPKKSKRHTKATQN